MPIDPAFAALVADPRNTLRPVAAASIESFRRAAERGARGDPGPALFDVENTTIGGLGGPLSVRIYRPTQDRPLPAVLFCHGGGFVFCSLETHDDLCRVLALRSGAVVVAVDYRRAPEIRAPGAADDCRAALGWLRQEAGRLGVDRDRIALCGDSAGGHLALAMALAAPASGSRLAHLGLIYPMVDFSCDSPSQYAFADGPVVTRDFLRWGWSAYLGEVASGGSLLTSAQEFVGLPPASILTAEYDPLRDEGEALAARLRAAGIAVTARRYLGMVHGFASMAALTPVAAQAIGDLAGDLRASFGG